MKKIIICGEGAFGKLMAFEVQILWWSALLR